MICQKCGQPMITGVYIKTGNGSTGYHVGCRSTIVLVAASIAKSVKGKS